MRSCVHKDYYTLIVSVSEYWKWTHSLSINYPRGGVCIIYAQRMNASEMPKIEYGKLKNDFLISH